jgi:putative restriction endonuclease
VSELEAQLRQRIMDALASRAASNGGVVSRTELSDFAIGDGETRRLIDPGGAGIWNPQDLAGTLTIISSPDGPYNDTELDGGLLRYDYRAGSNQGQNAKLRRAMELGLPLILLRKIRPGVLVPVFPVYVTADDRPSRQFVIALDESLRFIVDPLHPNEAERRYAQRVVKQRLHQPEFRARVIQAYERSCAICALRHPELLDASHIIEDRAEHGLPVVSNGLSLCKIHHAAFDRDLVGISPDRIVHVNRELLEEIDGLMLRHGLQEMHGRAISVPRSRRDQPDRDRLDARFQRFLSA